MSVVTIRDRTDSGRALKIFDTIESGFIVHAVTDHGCEPMIQPGEVAVITDQEQLYPEPGGWYLIEYSNGKSYRGRERRCRCICVANVTEHRGEEIWSLKSPAQRTRGVLEMSDGPYRDFNDIAEKVLGRVVGIYRPVDDGGRS